MLTRTPRQARNDCLLFMAALDGDRNAASALSGQIRNADTAGCYKLLARTIDPRWLDPTPSGIRATFRLFRRMVPIGETGC